MLGITHAQKYGQRGFTLIEMSIVLVIIGLIIGGILKGQEIIESSRQKNVITQLDSVKASINTFADKFNALPGDYSLAPTRINGALVTGANDDGIIGADQGSTLTAASNTGEPLEFWNHLTAAELVSGTTLNGSNTVFGDGGALPATAVPGTGMTVIYGDHDAGSQTRQTHWVRIHKNATGGTDGVTDGAFSGKRMFEIDLKVDDGQGFSGTARVDGETAGTCILTDNVTGPYDSLDNTQVCVPFFELVQ